MLDFIRSSNGSQFDRFISSDTSAEIRAHSRQDVQCSTIEPVSAEVEGSILTWLVERVQYLSYALISCLEYLSQLLRCSKFDTETSPLDSQEISSDYSHLLDCRCLEVLYLFYTTRPGCLEEDPVYVLSDTQIRQSIIHLGKGRGNRISFKVENAKDPRERFQMEALDIHIDVQGQIVNLYVDGVVWEENQLSDIWNQRLNEIMDEFILEHGIKEISNQAIRIHPLVLSRCPEMILERCCALRGDRRFELRFGHIQFLTDTFDAQLGHDSGGLSYQFMSQLSKHLLDNRDSRDIKLNRGLPVIEEMPSGRINNQQKWVLRNIGKMMAFCQQDQRAVIGRVLPDLFFGMMKTIDSAPKDESEEQLIFRVFESHFQDIDKDQIGEICTLNRDPTREEKEIIDSYQYEVAEGDYSEAVRLMLLDTYRPIVRAAQCVIAGFSQDDRAQWRELSAENLSQRIQGVVFNRQFIAEYVVTVGTLL